MIRGGEGESEPPLRVAEADCNFRRRLRMLQSLVSPPFGRQMDNEGQKDQRAA